MTGLETHLPQKARKVAVLEEARKDITSEIRGIVDEEGFPVFAPSDVISQRRVFQHSV